MAESRPSLRVPLALGTLVVVLVAGLWWGWEHAIAPVKPPTQAEICATASPTPLPSSSIHVNVLNGGARGGTGGQVANNLSQLGFEVDTVANTAERISTTVIRAKVVDTPSVRLVAGFFPGASVEADGREDDSIDILVGKDFAPMLLTAPTATMLPAPGCGPTPTPGTSATAPAATAEATPTSQPS